MEKNRCNAQRTIQPHPRSFIRSMPKARPETVRPPETVRNPVIRPTPIRRGRPCPLLSYLPLEITRRELAMRIDGKHRHVFSTRTAGLRNRLLCLGENIIPGGPKTDEFTWFPGYAWQAVGCSGCSSMLGWRYFGKTAASTA